MVGRGPDDCKHVRGKAQQRFWNASNASAAPSLNPPLNGPRKDVDAHQGLTNGETREKDPPFSLFSRCVARCRLEIIGRLPINDFQERANPVRPRMETLH